MTNKEAAEDLRKMHDFLVLILRGNGKYESAVKHIEALARAVEVLEKTPD